MNNYIKGKEGTDAAITCTGQTKMSMRMSVTRRKIKLPTVEYSILDDKSAGLQSGI